MMLKFHHPMQLWQEDHCADLLDHVPYWKLAQALFEVLPRDEEDWKLISSLLGERYYRLAMKILLFDCNTVCDKIDLGVNNA